MGELLALAGKSHVEDGPLGHGQAQVVRCQSHRSPVFSDLAVASTLSAGLDESGIRILLVNREARTGPGPLPMGCLHLDDPFSRRGGMDPEGRQIQGVGPAGHDPGRSQDIDAPPIWPYRQFIGRTCVESLDAGPGQPISIGELHVISQLL